VLTLIATLATSNAHLGCCARTKGLGSGFVFVKLIDMGSEFVDALPAAGRAWTL
jgi:hypothetical protein